MIVDDLENAVLDPKGISKIVARWMAFDLGLPPFQIFAVENRNPAVLARFILCVRDEK
jgi:hypothetical protein